MFNKLLVSPRTTCLIFLSLVYRRLRHLIYRVLPPAYKSRKRNEFLALLDSKKKNIESLNAHSPVRKGGPLNILQFNTFDNVGGAAVVAWRLHNIYNSEGHNSAMFVKNKQSRDKNVFVIESGKKDRRYWNLCRAEGWQFWNYLSTFDIPFSEQFRNSDMLHFHNLHGEYFNYLALPGLTRLKPSVWTLHDMQAITGHCAVTYDCERWKIGCGECYALDEYPGLEVQTSAMLLKKKKEIFSASEIDLVAPSRWLLDKVKQSILSDKDVHLIYNGVDPEVFRNYPREEMRKKFGIPEGKTVFITSAAGGILNPYKGGPILLEALKRLENKEDLVVVSIGNAEYIPKIKGIDWINTGHLFDEREIAQWYSAGDLLLYPSVADNCPLAVLEAMACGLPVVTFRTGGIPELVKHMETGYVAGYKDVEDLLCGVRLVVGDKEFRLRAGRRARAEVEKTFTLDKMARSYLNLYHDVIAKRAERVI